MKQDKTIDRVSRRAVAAQIEGISYGQWMAKYRPFGTEPEAKENKSAKPLIKKTCPHCKTEFVTTAGNKIYCCSECRIAARERRKYRYRLSRRKAREEKC